MYFCTPCRWLNMSRNTKLWLCLILYSCVWQLFIGISNLKLAWEPNPRAAGRNLLWHRMLFSRQPVVFFESKVKKEWLILLTGVGVECSFSQITRQRSTKFIAFCGFPQSFNRNAAKVQCFSTAGPRPGTGTWHQLHRAARGSPGICHFNFLSSFHE